MHTSLDGFVAGTKGEMDWIHVDDDIFEIAGKLTEQSDTALYGRVTYEMMENYWPTAGDNSGASKHDIQHSQWYNNVTKIVISKSLKNSGSNKTEIISSNVSTRVEELKKETKKDIVIFGSPTASHSLMVKELIDEYYLLINPVILGAGIPLFKNINRKVNLTLAESNTFTSGVVGLHYLKK